MIQPDEEAQHRRWTWWWLAVLGPLVVLGPSFALEFGLRDDYSILREVHEQPGKVLAFCASQGRLVYGFLLERSFAFIDGVDGLAYGRLLGALLTGLAGASVARTLARRFGWSTVEAIGVGVLLTLLPAPQVISSWAITWPHAFAGWLGVSAFALAEGSVTRERRRWAFVLLALAVLIVGTLTYQSNALLYLVPLAAGWLRAEPRRGWRWLSVHLGLVAAALTASYVITVVLFRALGFAISDRVAIDWDVPGKLAWFTANPLREAMALFVLRDNLGRTEPWYTAAQYVTAAASVSALVASSGIRDTLRRATGWMVILCAAYAVSFVAIERWAAYRTLWPLTGVTLVAAWLGGQRWIEWMARGFGRRMFEQPSDRVWAARLPAAALIAVAAISASWNVRQLIAKPQALEWARMRDIAADFDPSRGGRVFVVLPRPADTTAAVRHLDEFGSLSADCDWAALEMFKLALRTEHASTPNPAAHLAWQSGYAVPAGTQVARVIDFRDDRRVSSEVSAPIDTPRRNVPQPARPVFR